MFGSLRGKHPDPVGDEYQPPSGPPSDRRRYDPQEFQPPPGPPPGRRGDEEDFEPPSGAPPRRVNEDEDFQPPPGPPPPHRNDDQDFQPPSFPPPARQDTLPPYHDWTSIPDTALLPPPPSFGFDYSPTGNSSREEGDRAVEFCRRYPLWSPVKPSDQVYNASRDGDVRLAKPREYNGHLIMPGRGRWSGSTKAGQKDAVLLTTLPLYFAQVDSPLVTEQSKIVYFELKILSLGRGRRNEEVSIAIGFAAQPYPSWRSPGWERGSIGVFSDDGRRFVNDPWGGNDFTTPFKEGETVGIGITYSIPTEPPQYGQQGPLLNAEAFLCRNGRKEGAWNLLEERDKDKGGGIEGLQGDFDLYGAIGVFGGVEFESCFDSRSWLWRPQ